MYDQCIVYYRSKQRCMTKVLYCITKVNKDVMTKVLYYKNKQRCLSKVLYYKSKQIIVLQ